MEPILYFRRDDNVHQSGVASVLDKKSARCLESWKPISDLCSKLIITRLEFIFELRNRFSCLISDRDGRATVDLNQGEKSAQSNLEQKWEGLTTVLLLRAQKGERKELD